MNRSEIITAIVKSVAAEFDVEPVNLFAGGRNQTDTVNARYVTWYLLTLNGTMSKDDVARAFRYTGKHIQNAHKKLMQRISESHEMRTRVGRLLLTHKEDLKQLMKLKPSPCPLKTPSRAAVISN